MRILIGFAAFLLLSVSRPINAEEILTIHKVEGETDAKGSTVTVKFSGKVPWAAPELEDHGGFLQVKLPRSITPESGVFLDGTGSYIDKMAVFQTSAKDAALRLFVSKKSDALKGAMAADILEDRLILSLDNAKLEALGLTDHQTQKNEPAAATATKIDDPLAETSAKQGVEKALAFGKEETNDLKGKTGAVAVFSIIMMSGLMLFHMTRRFFRSKKHDAYKEPVASIKTLASHSLAPKHRLTLVQVGGEQILLGVSPDGISFLTTVGREKRDALPAAFALPQAAMPALREAQPHATPTLPRSDAVQPRKKKKEESAVAAKAPEAPKSTFSFAIDDEGVKTLEPKAPNAPGSMSQKSIEDVTSLIRRKLRNLPNA